MAILCRTDWLIRGVLPTPPEDIPSDTDCGDDLARRGDTAFELGLRLDSRGDGRRPHNYTARSRHGAANQLARQLVARRVPRSADGHQLPCAGGTMTYRSFHAAATRTFSEGERTLRRFRYREPPEGSSCAAGPGKNAFHRRWPMTWRPYRPTGVKRRPRRPSRPATATDATPISGPSAYGRAFAALPGALLLSAAPR